MLFDDVKKIMIQAKKDKNENLSMATNMIIGETARVKNKSEVDDELILDIIDKLIKNEKEVLWHKKENTSGYLMELEKFQRVKCSEETMINYLSKIDFSKLKNNLAAIGMLKKEFGEKNVDSDQAKKIIMERFS